MLGSVASDNTAPSRREHLGAPAWAPAQIPIRAPGRPVAGVGVDPEARLGGVSARTRRYRSGGSGMPILPFGLSAPSPGPGLSPLLVAGEGNPPHRNPHLVRSLRRKRRLHTGLLRRRGDRRSARLPPAPPSRETPPTGADPAHRGRPGPSGSRHVAALPTDLGGSQNNSVKKACSLKFVYFKT